METECERPPANLVFLIDVSGSMDRPERLPLVQSSLLFLIERLRPEDSVAIVTYSDEVRLALPPTPKAATRAVTAPNSYA